MRTAAWWVAVALVAMVVGGCGGKAAEQPGPAAANTITILGKDNLYEPVTVEIKAGQEYEIVFKNQGTGVHDLMVQAKAQVGEDFRTDVVVNEGQESKFKVKIDKEGTYTMVCTYHPEMKGELKVTK
jgi:plastocyanin